MKKYTRCSGSAACVRCSRRRDHRRRIQLVRYRARADESMRRGGGGQRTGALHCQRTTHTNYIGLGLMKDYEKQTHSLYTTFIHTYIQVPDIHIGIYIYGIYLYFRIYLIACDRENRISQSNAQIEIFVVYLENYTNI